MREIKRDCQFYKNKDKEKGCTALKRLFCSIEDKPCNFYKQKGNDTGKR